MQIQLLTNEAMVKGLMPVSDNLAGEYLATAMFEAQEIDLKAILGQRLTDLLKRYESNDEWSTHPEYEELKDQCQTYLAYRTIARVLPKVSFKICNAGAVATSDANVANLSRDQIDAMIEDYGAAADSFAYQLQLWLKKAIDNADNGIMSITLLTSTGDVFVAAGGAVSQVRGASINLPEADCNEIRANLYSAASCGIFLGGARGQRL